MSRLFSFIGAEHGDWVVTRQQALAGQDLPAARCVTVAAAATAPAGLWALRGIISNERYVERHEKTQLLAVQPGLGRPEARCAALIPIRKSAAWWALTQDERREVFEAQSQHTAIGLRFLPAIARRLHHCRDLGENEPFDFLTWFEFAPEYAGAFDDLLAALRTSPEWRFVDREVDIRLSWPA